MHMESKILKIGKNRWEEGHLVGTPLREKCPNMELFLVSISCIQSEFGHFSRSDKLSNQLNNSMNKTTNKSRFDPKFSEVSENNRVVRGSLTAGSPILQSLHHSRASLYSVSQVVHIAYTYQFYIHANTYIIHVLYVIHTNFAFLFSFFLLLSLPFPIT